MRKAFTLAEVLISLGIIGVVAATTIPTLVNNFNRKTWDSAIVVFERKLSEAVKVMNVQQTLSGQHSTENFVNELSKHIKINKICENNELLNCFENSVVWGNGSKQEVVDMSLIKTSKHFGQYYWNTNIVGILFANGVSGLVAYNPECESDPFSTNKDFSSCYALLYDTSGFKNPNTSGKDVSSINVKSLSGNCAFLHGGTCYSALFAPDFVTKAECDEMVASGEFGIKNCYYAQDYWAGAVKACGHVSKLPTQKQLADIASFVYGIDIAVSGTFQGTRNDDKAAELGFKNASASNNISLWSGEQYSQGGANLRHFKRESTNSSGHSKSDGGVRAFCVVY